MSLISATEAFSLILTLPSRKFIMVWAHHVFLSLPMARFLFWCCFLSLDEVGPFLCLMLFTQQVAFCYIGKIREWNIGRTHAFSIITDLVFSSRLKPNGSFLMYLSLPQIFLMGLHPRIYEKINFLVVQNSQDATPRNLVRLH